MTWLPARPPGWGTLPRCSVGNPSPPSSRSCGGSSPRTAAPGDGGRAPPRGAGGGGRPCGGFRVSAPGVFCLRLYCSMAYLCHLGLPGVYVTLWARIRYKTASFLASSSSGQLGAFGCRSIPFARQPVMVGLWGALSPSLSGIVRFPRLPVYVPCPLPGSAGSLRRPRPLSLEVVSEAGVWVLGAPGYRGVVACRASQRTACARTHEPLCVERLCPGDADREVAPAPLALPRQSPGAWLRRHPRPQWGPRLPAPTAPLRCRLPSVGSGRPPRAPWETTHGCRGPGLVRVASTRSSFPAPSAGSGTLDRPPCSGSHAGASGNVLGDRGGQMRLAAGDVSGPLRLEQERDL